MYKSLSFGYHVNFKISFGKFFFFNLAVDIIGSLVVAWNMT